MKKRMSLDVRQWLEPKRLWLGFFGLWCCFLSGALAPIGGGPGVLQAIRLSSLLADKEAQKAEVEAEIERLDLETGKLEKSRTAQEREIRRVLGYTGPDDIIFDFTAAERIADVAAN